MFWSNDTVCMFLFLINGGKGFKMYSDDSWEFWRFLIQARGTFVLNQITHNWIGSGFCYNPTAWWFSLKEFHKNSHHCNKINPISYRFPVENTITGPVVWALIWWCEWNYVKVSMFTTHHGHKHLPHFIQFRPLC
jgi:hypothetical protein